jgi:hypothetical protein
MIIFNFLKKPYKIILKNLSLTLFSIAIISALIVIYTIYEQSTHTRDEYPEYDFPQIAADLQLCYDTHVNIGEMSESEAAQNYRSWRSCILSAQSLVLEK